MFDTAPSVAECLSRIRQFGGKEDLNCIAELDPDPSPAAPGPLSGLPILVKDNIDVKGLHTTAGSIALRDNIARNDAPVVARLRKAGCVILGKTAMTEFANFTSPGMPNGFSSLAGQVKSAFRDGRDPSGSSTGSAVAVAAGMCGAALGTDTSFSVVYCALENGVTGLKPAHGALPQEGVIPISRVLDSVGVIARDLAEAFAVANVMRNAPLPLPEKRPLSRLRLAINTANRDMKSQRQLAFEAEVYARLASGGAIIREICQSPTPHMAAIMRGGFRRDLEEYLSSSDSPVKTLREILARYDGDPRSAPYGVEKLTSAMTADGEEYAHALAAREQAIPGIREELLPFDACAMTGPTNVMHFAGLPSLSVTTGRGLHPRGIVLYGADEEKLVAASLAVEECIRSLPDEWSD